jgi:hypothetical protein
MAQRNPEANLRADWSRVEVEATVADYFSMLGKELSGVPYNKAAHRRQLLTLLNNRSEQSIEFKHANISAVLLDLGFYRLFAFRTSPQLFTLNGALSVTCRLSPSTFLATIR